MARIPYSQQSPFGSKIYVAVQQLRNAQYAVLRCIDEANSISAGGTQPANLETQTPQTDAGSQFAVAVGQGSNFYNALQSLKAAIIPAGVPVQATIDLDQG